MLKEMKQNLNPLINKKLFKYKNDFLEEREKLENDGKIEDEIDIYEIFDLIRNINDPEHPYNLEELNIISLDDIIVDNINRIITVYFTPTIENCGFASLIGLSIKKKLLNFISPKYNIDVLIKEQKNESDKNLNKQMNDKERLEASNLNKNIVEFCSTSTIDTDEYLNFLKN